MTSTKKAYIGEGVNRIDGLLKVTGAAQYSTDYAVKNVAYAVLIKSEIAAGRIAEIDASAAEKSKGVLAVLTHKNAPKLNERGGIRGNGLLQSDKIGYSGETIGVVVAETFEQARAAAELVKVKYDKAAGRTDFHRLSPTAEVVANREAKKGDFEAAFASAEHKIDITYETPVEHHQPMEPHATTAVWEGENLTLYNPSQVIMGARGAAASTLNLRPEQVRIVSPHIGGGFGSKGGIWSNTVLAAVAAKAVNRPVKLALTRQQMFNSVGLRQLNKQRMRVAADKSGKLIAIAHDTVTHTAIDSDFIEGCGDGTRMMYDAPNSLVTYRKVPMNVISPTFTRGPGKAPGSFALESAIDEMAHLLKMDPVEFRIKNEPEKDPSNGKPWSSRSVVKALQEGARVFGWNKRKMEPRQARQGSFLVGYGVGCGTYPARQRDTSAIVKLSRKGNDVEASIELAASDLGTGTHTILAQTAAEELGLPMEKVGIKIGDSSLPPAAGSVGSVGAASFANAVYDGCVKITDELMTKSGKQWFDRPTAAALMISENLTSFETRVDAKPPANVEEYSSHSFNANFAEVWVDELTGMVRVPRFVAVTAAGNILNPKTSRSQIIGGVIWGIGMALTEEAIVEPTHGNFITRSFADYHIPANLDIGEIETIFVNEEDRVVNKMGVKGIGEVGIVGVAGAVANAIFNATGKRVRELPITPDKLL
jgi:xanthine dehydrogenase YagR molybdenum-binding subunit